MSNSVVDGQINDYVPIDHHHCESYKELAQSALHAYIANHGTAWANRKLSQIKIMKRFRKWLQCKTLPPTLSMLFLACLDIVGNECIATMDNIYIEFKDLYMLDDGDETISKFTAVVVEMGPLRDLTLSSLQENVKLLADTKGNLPVYGVFFLSALKVDSNCFSEEQQLRLYHNVTTTFKRYRTMFEIRFDAYRDFVLYISMLLGRGPQRNNYDEAEVALSLLAEHVDVMGCLLDLNIDPMALSYVDMSAVHQSIDEVFQDFKEACALEGWSSTEFVEFIKHLRFNNNSPESLINSPNPIDNVTDALSLIQAIQNTIRYIYQRRDVDAAGNFPSTSCGLTPSRSPATLSTGTGMGSRTISSDEIHFHNIADSWGNTDPP